MTKHRTASSLLASGAATITFDHRLRAPRTVSVAAALRGDKAAIARDGRRARAQALRDGQ